MQLPIKVLKDKDQNPFIPFVTTSSVVENGTNRTLDDILHNLTVPVTNLNSLENTVVADMMTNMKDYKDSGFAIIYVNTDNTGLLLAFEKITTVDALNKCWSFISSFNADSKAYRINITGYYNTDNGMFTVSSAAIEELKQNSKEVDVVYNIVETIGTNFDKEYSRYQIPTNLTKKLIDVYNDAKRKGYDVITIKIYDKPTGTYKYTSLPYIELHGTIELINHTWETMFTVSPIQCYSGYGGAQAGRLLQATLIIDVYSDGVDDEGYLSADKVGFSYFAMGDVNNLKNYSRLTEVLTKTNTTEYVPTKDFHPTTKQYVDITVSNAIDALPSMQDLVDNGFVYDTHTGETVEITTTMTNVSTTYGFALNDSGYYESNNKGKANSWALCKVTINTPQAFTLTIPYISSGENSYDYGIFGQLDIELANNYVDDGRTGSTKVKLNCKGQSSTDVKEVTYDIPAGAHFIEIKYRKDSSNNAGNDSLQFKVDPLYTFTNPVYVNKKLATTDILDTLPGYDASKTQVLKNVNGTIKWVTEEVA